jgi:hypothetical protein
LAIFSFVAFGGLEEMEEFQSITFPGHDSELFLVIEELSISLLRGNPIHFESLLFK